MEIIYSKDAIKFLKKQTRQTQERIISAIENIPDGDIRNLKGRSGYRLRVGTFRVLFDEKGTIINIIDINNRGQIYK